MAAEEGKGAPEAHSGGAGGGAPRDGEPKDGPALKHVDSKGLIKVPAKKKQKEVRRSSMDALKGLFRKKKDEYDREGKRSVDGSDGSGTEDDDAARRVFQHQDSKTLLRARLSNDAEAGIDDSDASDVVPAEAVAVDTSEDDEVTPSAVRFAGATELG